MSNYAKDMFIKFSESYNITLVEWNAYILVKYCKAILRHGI